MAERAPEALRPPPWPGTPLGMRGGLGRTLLTAFLFLAIVPLGLLAFVTYNQIQKDAREKVLGTLATVAELQRAHLVDWAAGYERELAATGAGLDAAFTSGQADAGLGAWLARPLTSSSIETLLLVDETTGQVVASSDPARKGSVVNVADGQVAVAVSRADGDRATVAIGHRIGPGRMLVGLVPSSALQAAVSSPPPDPRAGELTTYLIMDDNGMLVSEHEVRPGAAPALSGAYVGPDGVPVYGASIGDPRLKVTVVAEQRQAKVLGAGSTLTAAIVAIALGMALVTAASAAVVTRQVTRPIVQLTETAARMARGDLDQQVTVTRQDEIGVLARAFNRMAAELRVLYGNLEAKVAERTGQLEEANEQARHHAIQLGISAEVARVATSIRDLDELLGTVVGLIARAFELDQTALWLMPTTAGGETADEWTVWEVTATGAESRRERVEPGSRVGQAALGQIQAEGASQPGDEPDCLAVPLHVHGHVLGVLDLHSRRPGTFERHAAVYRSLADQVSVAIENARVYGLERATIRRWQELDRLQSQFLTNMSHALRTPLTSVIGFSRLVLKELDGPLTDLQRTDVTTIHNSGQQLLGLINDMLELSQLEMGTAPITWSQVELGELLEGVLTTVRALARTRDLRLIEEVPPDLPTITTDAQRVRQVVLALLSNACKFTEKGTIWLRVGTSPSGESVIISVQDTGMGIPAGERARIFGEAQPAEGQSDDLPKLGLAISKRVIEKLGGQIWVQSDEGVGSTFTFTLPLKNGRRQATGGPAEPRHAVCPERQASEEPGVPHLVGL